MIRELAWLPLRKGRASESERLFEATVREQSQVALVLAWGPDLTQTDGVLTP